MLDIKKVGDTQKWNKRLNAIFTFLHRTFKYFSYVVNKDIVLWRKTGEIFWEQKKC